MVTPTASARLVVSKSNNVNLVKTNTLGKENSRGRVGALAAESNDDDGKQGIPASTFSLVKALVGSGVLSLSGELYI